MSHGTLGVHVRALHLRVPATAPVIAQHRWQAPSALGHNALCHSCFAALSHILSCVAVACACYARVAMPPFRGPAAAAQGSFCFAYPWRSCPLLLHLSCPLFSAGGDRLARALQAGHRSLLSILCLMDCSFRIYWSLRMVYEVTRRSCPVHSRLCPQPVSSLLRSGCCLL